MPNATFKEFDGDGFLSQWRTISAPIRRVAWNVYARPRTSGARFARQNDGPLPLSRASYSQFSTLSDSGPPSPNPATRPPSGTPPPEASVLKSILTSEAGLAEGYYGVSLAWCVFSREYPDRRFTGLSPRETAEITSGSTPKMITVDLYDSIPDGAVGLGVFSTEPQDTEELALDEDTPVYLQRVISTEAGDYPSTYNLEGPLRKGELGTSSNDSYVGEFEAYDEPIWDYASSSDALIEAVAVQLQLSWSFRTEFGRSASQKVAPYSSIPTVEWIEVEAGSGAAIRLRPPERPPGALDWRPEWRGQGENASGNWYTYVSLDPERQGGAFDAYAYIFIADEGGAIELQEGYQLEPIDRSQVDDTGIPTPDLAPPALTVSNITLPTETSIEVITTWELEDGTQTGPSPAMTLTGLVSGTNTWRVYLPPGGNMLPNPEFELRVRKSDGTATLLQDWTLATGSGIAFTTGEGEATLVDSSASSSSAAVFYNEQKVAVTQGKDYCVRFDFETSDYTSGRARVILRELLANGTTNVDTVLVSHTANGEAFGTETSIGTASADHPLDPDTAYLRLVIENNGAVAGVRDLSWTLSNAGIFEGLVAPRKRYITESSLASTAEEKVRCYPVGAYVAVVEDPPDEEKPDDLAGVPVNMIEYFAPADQTPSDFLVARGLRIPVRPGQTYTLSSYLEGKGLTEVSADSPQMLLVDLKDENGVSLGLGGASAELAVLTGYSPWNRYAKTITPANLSSAAYLEILGSHQVGAGMLRIIAPQFETGVSATEFDFEVAEEGYVTLDFDTQVEDAEDGDPMNSIRGIEGADIVSTLRDPDVGSVTAEYASSSDGSTYSSFYDDVLDMPLARYIRIKVTLSSV